MTEPRNPGEPEAERPIEGTDAAGAAGAAEPPADAAESTVTADTTTAPATGDSPTQAWPSLATPPATSPAAPSPSSPGGTSPDTTAPASDAPASTWSAPPANTTYDAGETGTFGAAPTGPSTTDPAATPVPAAAPSRGRPGLRWILAIGGVVLIAGVTALIVSLAGGRPTTSVAIGYMPPAAYSYSEFRLDLPGDQRQKLAAYLSNFPGFDDQSQIETKLSEVLDRIVRLATQDKQSWSSDIKPWFGGQIGVGMGLPDRRTLFGSTTGLENALLVVTITDRSKTIAWLESFADMASINRTTYGNADFFDNADRQTDLAVAITDKVLIVGVDAAVRAAVDSNGASTFGQDENVKAALATIDADYVGFTVTRSQAYLEGLAKLFGSVQPGTLENTQIDDTLLAMVPAWQASVMRFEKDAIVVNSVGPSFTIGYDATNRTSELVGHVPAKTLLYFDFHDVGQSLSAFIGKFRGLPELQDGFRSFDQGLGVLGGYDATFGWWGDTAIVVSSLDNGTIGGGLVIKPRDAAAAERLMTTLNSYAALGATQGGFAIRTEDHAGTDITILDLSGVPGMNAGSLPPGYKAEVAWATNKDVTVFGYGREFVAAVLDAGPGNSLNDDARFKALLNRVGAENISVGFIDVNAIRTLAEPLLRTSLPAEQYAFYERELKPYIENFDALIGTNRKDGSLDRGSVIFTAH